MEITHTVTFGAATPVEGEMPTLMAPTNVRSVLNTAGSLIVGWDAAAGAEGYVIIAINTSDFSPLSMIVVGGGNDLRWFECGVRADLQRVRCLVRQQHQRSVRIRHDNGQLTRAIWKD